VLPGSTEPVSGDVSIVSEEGSPVNRRYTVQSRSPGMVRINQFYFQGWTALLDNRPVHLAPDPNTGLITVTVPAGTHALQVTYSNLPIARRLARAGIIVIIILIGSLSVREFRRKIS